MLLKANLSSCKIKMESRGFFKIPSFIQAPPQIPIPTPVTNIYLCGAPGTFVYHVFLNVSRHESTPMVCVFL